MIVTDKEQNSALLCYLSYWRLKVNVGINNKDGFCVVIFIFKIVFAYSLEHSIYMNEGMDLMKKILTIYIPLSKPLLIVPIYILMSYTKLVKLE